jgi:monomeric sarcosine oxidase
LRSASDHDLSVDELSAKQVDQRWPGFSIPNQLVGVFEPAAGYLLVEDCVRAHLDAARDVGADLLTETEVQGWTASDCEVRVQTSSGEFSAQRLIITAGSWTGTLLRELRVSLTVRRKSLFWFATDATHYNVAAGFPVFLFELRDDIFYGFPNIDARGVKVAEHTGGRSVEDPLTVDRSVDADEQRRLIDFLSWHLPGVSSTVAHHTVCLYTMSLDESFIVDRHPQHANVVFAAGLSGHGFKFVPVLGRALAELALDGGTELPIGFLSLSRFA